MVFEKGSKIMKTLSFIAASPPSLPIFDREGEGLEDLVVMATSHTSILPGPMGAGVGGKRRK